MSSKYILLVCGLAVAAAVPGQPGPGTGWSGSGVGGWSAGVNPWMPSWLATAPWNAPRVSCTGIGSTCQDCSTRLVCTKVGGLTRACTDPKPYCNLGECSASPTLGCGLA